VPSGPSSAHRFRTRDPRHDRQRRPADRLLERLAPGDPVVQALAQEREPDAEGEAEEQRQPAVQDVVRRRRLGRQVGLREDLAGVQVDESQLGPL
jgi:hypothetical protein